MKFKSSFFFILTAVISLIAASHRFYDSAHAIGLITVKGGKARHPIVLDAGKTLYTLIITATVIPPYSGDAQIVLEGNPQMAYFIYNSDPVFDIGIYRRPEFRNNTLYELRPTNRIAFWVVMKPDGECDKTMDVNDLKLILYDTKTKASVLNIPILFRKDGKIQYENRR